MYQFKYIVFVVIGLLLASCSIDREPLDKYSASQFWNTRNDFDMAMTAIYGRLQTPVFSYGSPDWDLITDNAYGQHNSNRARDIAAGEIAPSLGGFISDVYSNAYAGIARVNIFLGKLNEYDGDFLPADLIISYEAEAKFMRAYYYYMLYACYGDVPLVEQALDLNNFVQPKASAEEILNFIYQDLDRAIELLPGVTYAEGNGRVVKSSAQALKLRVLMYTAYNSDGSPKVAVLTQARDLAREIMSAGYQLSPVFHDVFRDNRQEGNPEIIFSVKFLAPNNATAMDQWYGDWVAVSPLPSFVALFEEGDERKEASIFQNVVDFGTGRTHLPSNNMPTGYGVKKFLTPENIPYDYSTRSAQDWVLFRYADILLSFAEAENEISGPTPECYAAINAIRARAGLANLESTSSKDEFRTWLRLERRLELAFEGTRYFDLKRWRIAGEVLNAVEDGIIRYNFQDRFYLWPIPQSQIDRSMGVLVQNPDY